MPSNTSGGNADLNGSNGTSGRKSKQAKPADPEETSKLVQAKYQELEQSRAEEREQAAEIGVCYTLDLLPMPLVWCPRPPPLQYLKCQLEFESAC